MTPAPPRRVAFALRAFALDRLRVLDLGCGTGAHLRHFGPGSVGLDLHAAPHHTGDHEIRRWSFADGIPDDLRDGFDAVWCSNLLEHALAPHELLLDARRALRPAGWLLAVVPICRRFAVGPWRGFLAVDHVNFFTPRTLHHTVARAGYDVRYLGSASFPRLPFVLGRALAAVSPNVLVAARAARAFQYPAKAHKTLVEGRVAFR